MNSATPFLSTNQPYAEALPWLVQRLSAAGLRVMQTFDLDSARVAAENCPCPHHGMAECDCQMAVLLVYGKTAGPTTLFLHGHDGLSWLLLIDTAMQHADPSVRASIEKVLQAEPKEGL